MVRIVPYPACELPETARVPSSHWLDASSTKGDTWDRGKEIPIRGGKVRFGEVVQVQTGRFFVIILTVIAYVMALEAPRGIFDLSVQ